MLLFFQNDVGTYRGRKDRSDFTVMMEALKQSVDMVLAFDKRIHPDFNAETNLLAKNKGPKNEDKTFGFRYQQTIVPMTNEAHDFWLDYEEQCHDRKRIDPEGFESAFVGRFAELTAKLALLDAVSIGRPKIEVDSLIWAKEVVETQWHNAKPLYEVAHAESKTESDVLRVLSFIKNVGIIDRSSLLRKCQWLEKRLFDQAINTLIESSQIETVQDSKSGAGRPKTFYRIHSFKLKE
jgi:predicted nucleic-acid-binding protein